ncbi:transposase [bacterium]|nr:transposase [bacterium]
MPKYYEDWKAYHITWVTHGSRISERMVKYRIKKSNPVMLDERSREIIAEALAKKAKEQDYRILAVNVLQDHVHCIVVCEEREISGIVRDLKGFSSHEHNRLLQLSVEGEGRQIKLWAKGSSQTLLELERHMLNAIEYVENNHLKHDLSEIASCWSQPPAKAGGCGTWQCFLTCKNGQACLSPT